MKFSLQIISLVFFTLTHQVSFASDTETRDLSSFSGISVAAGIEATLVQGDENSIEITVSGIELDKITTDISRGVLKVSVNNKNKWWKNLGIGSRRDVDVVITYKSELDYISSSSGSSVHAAHTINASNLELKTSSGANMELNLDVNDLEADLSSGSTMDLSGDATYSEIDLSSGSTYRGFNLKSKNVNVDGSSGSSAKVNVSHSLTADVSSGASVKYSGSPTDRDIDKSSGGSVNQVSKGNS